MLDKETYVYEGDEVTKTGRTASKQIQVLPSKVRTEILVEITPVSTDGFAWKKWVSEKSLFRVDS